MVRLPEVKLPKAIEKTLSMLEARGYQGYIVGGCVRDAMMGLAPHDYDITTSALPEEVKEVFDDFPVIETGIKHGTVTVVMGGYPIEITTFRMEGEYLDGRRPSSVSFTRNLREDVARRDFTINAMAMDVRGRIYDFFGGQEDLENGLIKAVGKPSERFSEDGLRIMRALRFASVTGFEIEAETARALFECKELLVKISAERLREELVKMLLGKDAKGVLLEYWDILSVVIPELMPMKDFDQRNPWHIYPVHRHTAVAVDSAPATPVLRMAALLHDVGKPKCFTVDEEGWGHFYGHAHVGVEMAREILSRLRFDNESNARILNLVKYHDVPLEPTPRAVRRALNKYGQAEFYDLIALKRADNLAQNPQVAIRQEDLDKLVAISEEIIAEEQCFSLKNLAVNGSDLIAMGLPAGREIGRILEMLLEAVIDEKIPNDKAKLLEFAQKIKK